MIKYCSPAPTLSQPKMSLEIYIEPKAPITPSWRWLFEREKKFKEFCQFRLNLLIKISYIPNFFKIYPGDQKLRPKKRFYWQFFQQQKNCSYFPKTGKNN